MAHLNNTLVRKKLANDAADQDTSYRKYMRKVEVARAEGVSTAAIIQELEYEAKRIEDDAREGDQIFQQGVKNAKTACMNAIQQIITELKGEDK